VHTPVVGQRAFLPEQRRALRTLVARDVEVPVVVHRERVAAFERLFADAADVVPNIVRCDVPLKQGQPTVTAVSLCTGLDHKNATVARAGSTLRALRVKKCSSQYWHGITFCATPSTIISMLRGIA